MTRLMKLELKKFGLSGKIITALVAIAFSILFITVSMVDSMTDPEQTKDTFESIFSVTGLLLSFIFPVYSSVLVSSLIINEYNQKTITILFCYPLNRKLLIVAKMAMIMIFTAAAMLIGYILCCSYIIAVDAAFDMLEGSFQPAYLSEWIPVALISVVVCSILSWWPFIAGITVKSVPVTIVTSLIVLLLRQIVITKNPSNQESIPQIVLVTVITFAAAAVVFRKKVTKLD